MPADDPEIGSVTGPLAGGLAELGVVACEGGGTADPVCTAGTPTGGVGAFGAGGGTAAVTGAAARCTGASFAPAAIVGSTSGTEDTGGTGGTRFGPATDRAAAPGEDSRSIDCGSATGCEAAR